MFERVNIEDYTCIIHDENNFSCILPTLHIFNKPLKNKIIFSNKIK
jgi:hypothetical protein